MKNWIIAACFFIYLNGCLVGRFYNPSAWYASILWINFFIFGIIGLVWAVFAFVKMMDRIGW